MYPSVCVCVDMYIESLESFTGLLHHKVSMACNHVLILDAECSLLLYVALLLPSPILTPRTPHLPSLKQTLPSPLLPRRIHIPRRLNRNPGPRSHWRRHLPIASLNLRHIYPLTCIELECGLCAVDFEMQFHGWMRERDEVMEGLGARVEGYLGLRVDDEAVVEGGGVRAEGEGCVWRWWGGWVGGYFAGGDGVGVEDEVLVCS